MDCKIKVRDGSEVKVRDVHNEILDIMDEIDRICRKYDITYGLMAGSALGIQNYNGFIPWDDDIDIFVKRDDYERFLEALDKELDDKIYYHCYEKNKKYNILIPTMKIRKRGTYIEEVNCLLDNRCSGNGVFVDVVTYGHINKNKFIDELYRTLVKLFVLPYILIDNLGFNPRIIKWILNKIDRHYEKISKNSDLISQSILIPWEKFRKEPVFKESDVYPVREYDFEGRKYYSYNNIPNIASKWWGERSYRHDMSKEWVETLPLEKRVCKHIKDVNLKGDIPNNKGKIKLDITIKVCSWLILFLIIFVVLKLIGVI